MSKNAKTLVLIIALLSFATVSCIATPAIGKVQRHTDMVELDDAETVTAEIIMGAGKLVVQSGTEALMEGEFIYNFPEYAADISYRVSSGGRGNLQVVQDDGPRFRIRSNYKNEWELTFNEDIPLDLDVTLGAGESVLDLVDLNLTSFQLTMGAGVAYLDLSGKFDQDLNVSIKGGVGELTLLLPPDTNIEAVVNGGLGEINTQGLYQEGDEFVSKYSGSGPVLKVSIDGGVGQLNLLVQ